ncbi:MAG: hypothetical protein AB1Z98_07130 [Nannocystaceae bacterium]
MDSPRPAANVELRIDALELRGFSPAHRFAIAEAVHAELGRLLQGGSLAAAADQANHTMGHTASHTASRTVTAPGLRADASPHAVGTAVARAIYDALPRG